MNMNKISKRLSWLLRHCQEPLYIDPQGGWAPVETILQALSKKNRTVDRQMLETIVATDEKGRYSFDASGDRIRANQGHSKNRLRPNIFTMGQRGTFCLP